MDLQRLRKGFVKGPGDELAVKREQHIPDEYIKSLQDEREARKRAPGMEWALLCSVPVALADEWLQRDGFNVYSGEADPEEIIRRLRKAEMDHFIVYS